VKISLKLKKLLKIVLTLGNHMSEVRRGEEEDDDEDDDDDDDDDG
jgi:hypothetical protein